MDIVQKHFDFVSDISKLISPSEDSPIFSLIDDMLDWVITEMEHQKDSLPVILDYVVNYNFGRDGKVLELSLIDIDTKKKRKFKIKNHAQLYDFLIKTY